MNRRTLIPILMVGVFFVVLYAPVLIVLWPYYFLFYEYPYKIGISFGIAMQVARDSWTAFFICTGFWFGVYAACCCRKSTD
jgi:hypothetical protein